MIPPPVELRNEPAGGSRSGSPSNRHTLAICFVLFFGTLLLFSRAVNHDFIDLDDPDYVTQNHHVQEGLSWSGVRWALSTDAAGNWHPATWLSHMLDWQLFGNNPHAHHATNILWHAFNVVLAFLVLRRLTGAFWTSAISAALFAVHPLRVESVAWVAERKDVLSTCFGLLTLLAYARFAGQKRGKLSSPEANAPLDVNYGLALLFFTLGLMCKPMLVTLPFVLLLLDVWPLNRCSLAQPGRALPGLVREKLPFLFLSLISCIVTHAVQDRSGAISGSMNFAERLANATAAVTGYLGKYFWPVDLAIGYPRPLDHPVALVAGEGLLLLGITGFTLWQWRSRPWLAVGWLWFLGMLVPVIGLVPVGQPLMADRYTYLPVLGLQFALLWTLREAVVFCGTYRLAIAGAVTVLIASSARTWNQLAVWQNSHSLYEHALAVNPDNYLAHTYLGSTLLNENRPEAACFHFQKAVALRPDYRVAQLRLARVLEKLGREQESLAVYLDWLKLRPDDAEAQFRCGNLLARLNRDPEAVLHYQQAIRLKPDFEPGRCNYADTLRALNRLEEAGSQYHQALRLQPRDANAYYGLGATLQDSDHPEEALRSYLQAVDLNPKFADAQYDAGVLLLDQNQPEAAAEHLQAALKIRTNFVSAYLALGLAQEQLDRTQAAIGSFEEAQRLDPDASGVSEALLRLREKLIANDANPKP